MEKDFLDAPTNGDVLEKYSHTFVLRVWLEETADEVGMAKWRGQISHVASSRKDYFEDLDTVRSIIKSYLHEMGIQDEG